MNPKIENILGDLTPKNYEIIKSLIETLEQDCIKAEERYKSLLEASKFQVVIQETPKKKNPKLPYKQDVREYTIEKLWAMRDTLTPSELKILVELI